MQNDKTEIQILKKISEKQYLHCQNCGRKFYTKIKRVKYCPECREKIKQKKYVNLLSDKQFKQLYKEKYGIIVKCVKVFIEYGSKYYDAVLEQTIVDLWIRWINILENGGTFKDCQKFNRVNIYLSAKRSFISVIRAKDLPPVINSYRPKKSIEQNEDVISLNAKAKDGISNYEEIVDCIIDQKPSIEKVLDLKKLTKQIMLESVLDTDVKAAIINEELKDISIQRYSPVTEQEKVKLINDEYELTIQSMKDLRQKAHRGIQKLYKVYADDIKEILEITDKSLKFSNTENRNLASPVARCAVCGKAFIPKTTQIVCSPECARKRRNETRNKQAQADRIKRLIMKAYITNSQEECEQSLEEVLELL